MSGPQAEIQAVLEASFKKLGVCEEVSKDSTTSMVKCIVC